MPSSEPVVVVGIVQVVDVQPQVNVRSQSVGNQSVHRPVSRDLSGVRGIAEALADLAEADDGDAPGSME